MSVNLVADDLFSAILVGGEGDQGNHPAWANEGSFMVFRTYEQRTPEFVAYVSSLAFFCYNILNMSLSVGVPATLRKWSLRALTNDLQQSFANSPPVLLDDGPTVRSSACCVFLYLQHSLI